MSGAIESLPEIEGHGVDGALHDSCGKTPVIFKVSCQPHDQQAHRHSQLEHCCLYTANTYKKQENVSAQKQRSSVIRVTSCTGRVIREQVVNYASIL